MRIILFTTFFIVLSMNKGFCQGGWNIGYLEIDSLSERDINLEVRLDFKSKVEETDPEFNIRKKLFPSNVEYLQVGEMSGWFSEVRNIGPDYGYFDDQILIQFNPIFGKMMLIRDSWIRGVSKDSVSLFVNLEVYDISGGEKSGFEKKEKVTLVVNKSILDGFLIRKE